MTLVLVIFAVTAAVVVLGVALVYLRRRLVRDPFAPGRQRVVAGAVFGGSLVLVVLCLLAAQVLPADPFAVFALPGYIALALLFYLLLALLVLELPRLLLRGAVDRGTHDPGQHRPHPQSHTVAHPRAEGSSGASPDAEVVGAHPASEDVDLARRRTIARALAGTAGAVATVVVGYGYVNATSRVKAKAVDVPLARTSTALDGLRIAVLSDIHLTSGLRERAWMAETVDTVNRQKVDLVAVVGDLVDGSVDELGPFARPMADFDAPLGAYFVTGNHEYISGADAWAEFLPTLGLRVLRNERISIDRAGGTFDLAGVDDVAGERQGAGPDIPGTLEGRAADRPVILLAHQPILAEEARDHGVDLQISGHTHGGQMWPLHYLVRLQQGHLAGLERLGDTVLFTSRGVGSWGPPVRVGAPPEISILTLRA